MLKDTFDTVFDFKLLKEKHVTNNLGTSNILLEEIETVFNNTPKRLTIPFMLHYEGYHYEEIAVKLDICVGTVKSRIHTARRVLMDSLQEYKYN